MGFHASFNNVLVTLLQSVLLVEKPEVRCEYHQAVTSHLQTLTLKVLSNKEVKNRIHNSNIYRRSKVNFLIIKELK